ncbi:hypothetical protein P152DRAFT_72393 [Eremomyces bilateralis CBS 781.70]|uniref:Uncharacterized protein n=1 Tax=Eremomyces bilateralis CBS 781.70 TaxID=1392243 RepID=A0A6G1FZ46_9PEZI|nr:uncharacterized protein P152DRAFT_72393 [Eremomyces bilateralis CBS 781.70]KAF1810950.1 hypothetical protein P152DRAFT_72393 [Eremomyces bilateralis CBS 781.70]
MANRAGKGTIEIERSLQQLTVGGSIELNEESELSRQGLIQELKNQQATNTALRDMCEEALSRTVYECTGQKIKGVKATNDSSALAGFINTSWGSPRSVRIVRMFLLIKGVLLLLESSET